MPTTLPMPTKAVGDIFTTTLWNSNLRDNLNKLLNTGHRTLTVAQFAALTGLEGTKGTVAGDEVYLEVDATAGILWHFVYESTEATYKWRFLGGPAMFAEVLAAEPTAVATYVALTTAGPAITLPRAGDFDVTTGCLVAGSGAATAGAFMSYDIGGTGAVDADAATAPALQGVGTTSCCRLRRKAALTAVALTAKYRSGTVSDTPVFSNRFMAVKPVRII